MKRNKDNLPSFLKTEIVYSDPEGFQKRELKGKPFYIKFLPKTRYQPAHLELMISTDFKPKNKFKDQITVEKKRNPQRSADEEMHKLVFKRMFDSFGIRIGNKVLDSQVRVETENPDFARIFFSPTVKQMALQALFELGFERFSLFSGHLSVEGSFDFPGSHPSETLVQKTLEQLELLAQDIPEVSSAKTLFGIPEWKVRFALSFIIAGGSVLCGLLFKELMGGETVLDSNKLLLCSMIISFPAFLLFSRFASKATRGAMLGCFWFGVILIVSLAGFTFSGAAFAEYLNCSLDKGEPSVHKVLVLDKFNPGKDIYNARVESWRENRETERIAVGHFWYHRITPDQTQLVITTKPGAFGFAWITEIDTE